MMHDQFPLGKKPPEDHRGRITFSGRVGTGIRTISIETENAMPEILPGQFFMVRLGGTLDPLLGRPFASISASGNSVDFLFRKIGKGTELLASLPPGVAVDLRGPCGNGFPVPSGRRLILVAGTLGIAPFLNLAIRSDDNLDKQFILGIPGKGWEEFTEWCSERIPGLQLISDDGTLGEQGTCVDKAMSSFRPGDEMWACGPFPMLRNLGNIRSGGCEKLFVSLENRMACGMGGCLGCSIRTRSGMARVCVDGPVFKWEEILWDEQT